MQSRLMLLASLAGSLLFTSKVLAQPPTEPAKAPPAEAAAAEAATAAATEPAPVKADAATHDELRAMREALTKAVLEGDVNAQLDRVHDNLVVTWQNNQVVRGKDGLKNFLGEISNGEGRVFQGYKVPPTADDLTLLYGGDAAIAFGSSTPHYKLHGMEFDLENRWTATLIKDGDAWKIAAYHVSGNILDNPVLDIAKRSLFWAGGLGLVVGLVLGAVVSRLLKRRQVQGV
jgi:ketosteroid isomerase-like protein